MNSITKIQDLCRMHFHLTNYFIQLLQILKLYFKNDFFNIITLLLFQIIIKPELFHHNKSSFIFLSRGWIVSNPVIILFLNVIPYSKGTTKFFNFSVSLYKSNTIDS